MRPIGISETSDLSVFSRKNLYLNFLDKKLQVVSTNIYWWQWNFDFSVSSKKSFDSGYLSVDSGLCMLIFSIAPKSISYGSVTRVEKFNKVWRKLCSTVYSSFRRIFPTTVLYINKPLGLRPRKFNNKTVVWLLKTNIKLEGN